MISQEEQNRHRKSVEYAIGSCELENCIFDDDVKNIYQRYINGELTSEEVDKEILKNLPNT